MGFQTSSIGQAFRASAAALSISGLVLSLPYAAKAVTFGGSTHFAGVPRLVSAKTTQKQARAWGGRYYFTVSVPEDASEPLGQLVIQQSESSDRLSQFRLDDTIAFRAGDRNTEYAIASVELNRDDRSIAVAFSPGIEPGQTVQLGLRPRRTPKSGVYLFGVTAFPEGAQPAGQFLGYGRLHFYDNNNRRIRWH